ncbi:MAG TPA: PAS domain S-box protein, partial [Geobacteraceae bacterium]|nr:PAS domain S-box protein [Geobacteraceae bacterium]
MGKYRLRDASEYAQNIVNTVREPLVVLDDKFRVISTNRSFSSTFKVTPEMSENTMLFDLGNGQWNIPKLRELLEKVLPKSTSIEDFEVEHDFPAIGRKTMLLNARRIRSKTGATQILLAIEDITDRKRAEEELQRINIELEEVLERETFVSQSLQAVFYPRIKQIEGYQF